MCFGEKTRGSDILHSNSWTPTFLERLVDTHFPRTPAASPVAFPQTRTELRPQPIRDTHLRRAPHLRIPSAMLTD